MAKSQYEEITDPAILAKLNAPEKSQYEEIKDPAILAKLNAPEETSQGAPGGFSSYLTSHPLDSLIGLMRFRQGLLGTPSKIAKYFSPEVAKKLKPSDKYLKAVEALAGPADTKTELTRSLYEAAPSLLAPEASLGKVGEGLEAIPYAGKYLKAALGGALPQAGIAYTQADDSPGKSALEAGGTMAPFSALSTALKSENPLTRILAKGLGMSLGGAAGYEGAKHAGFGEPTSIAAGALGAALGKGGKKNRADIIKSMTEGIEGTPYKENLERAKRLEFTYLTPAEAGLNPFTGAKQGSVGYTEKGAKLLWEKGEERLGSEEKAITKFFDTIHGPEEKLAQEKFFDIADPKTVNSEAIEGFKQDENIKDAIKNVTNEPAYREELKNVPDNSLEYWRKISEHLGDKAQTAPRKMARLIKDSQIKIRDKLDIVSKDYTKGRALSEREHKREALEKAFNRKDFTGNSFAAVMKNKKFYNDLMFGLRNVPEAQQQLEDLAAISKNLITVPSVKTAAKLKQTSMAEERSTAQRIGNSLQEFFSGGTHDTTAIELITNPKWAHELEKIKDMPNTYDKSAKFADLLGRALVNAENKIKD